MDGEGDRIRTQTRRKVTLESLSFAVPVASAAYFSGLLIVDRSPALSAAVAAGALSLLIALWVGHRMRVPPSIAAQTVAQESDGATASDDDSDDGGRWDAFSLALLVVGVVVVVTVGIAVRFILPLLVIGLFTAYSGDPGWRDLLLTIGCTLGTAFVLEFGVVLPLCKLWGLEFDEDPRPQLRP